MYDHQNILEGRARGILRIAKEYVNRQELVDYCVLCAVLLFVNLGGIRTRSDDCAGSNNCSDNPPDHSDVHMINDETGVCT